MLVVWINFCLMLYRCLMMQRCDGKQGCTNQIGMKKGEKAGSLSLLNISKRFADNWRKKRDFSGYNFAPARVAIYHKKKKEDVYCPFYWQYKCIAAHKAIVSGLR